MIAHRALSYIESRNSHCYRSRVRKQNLILLETGGRVYVKIVGLEITC